MNSKLTHSGEISTLGGKIASEINGSPLFQKTWPDSPGSHPSASQEAFHIHRADSSKFCLDSFSSKLLTVSMTWEIRAVLPAQETYTGLCLSVAQFHYLQNRDNGTKIAISIIMITLQAQHKLINIVKFDTRSSQSHVILYNKQIPFTARETVSKHDAIRLLKNHKLLKMGTTVV